MTIKIILDKPKKVDEAKIPESISKKMRLKNEE